MAFTNRKLYYVYITTNVHKKVLYTGLSNDPGQRITEHYLNSFSNTAFAGRYNAFYIVYYEAHKYINNAIAREKEIKGWRREKKVALINSFNPEWKFLNEEILGEWPPSNPIHRGHL
jgi:putative endonuclease